MKFTVKKITLLFFVLSSFISLYSQEESESELKKTIKENIRLEDKIDSLTKQFKIITEKNKNLSNELGDGKKEIIDLKSQKDNLKSQKDNLQKEISEMKKISYSKTDYDAALAKKEEEIKKLKNDFNQKTLLLEKDKKDIEVKNDSILSILRDMNSTFFAKKVKDNYTEEYLKNQQFIKEDSLSLRKYDVMIISLKADPSMSDMKFDKAEKFNDIYFSFFEFYSTFDFAYDSINVNKCLIKLNELNIPQQYEGLNKSKQELIVLLKDYCITQSKLFDTLLKYDQIKDGKLRFSELEKLSKNDKYKYFKYLREIISKYSKNSFDLPKTLCKSK